MRIDRFIISFIFLFYGFASPAQFTFRTIAPQEPVISGESFEIQYVVEGEDKIESFTCPPFTGFRLVTGPHIYHGSVIDLNIARPLVNTVYTLAALKPGKYFIPGARVVINGSALNSNDVFIQVISKQEAFKLNKRKDGSFYKNSEYFLHPAEDPIEKIRRNLFMKVTVDKKICYVGEPVVATYKLYSRLESKSDIVKNPGFYGFAVFDMVNLADHAQTIETINGKSFDVHTVRRVQLYPLQSGHYIIDPMEVSNKVEFSRSEVNKKTEQEIVEGVLVNNGDKETHNNTEVYESSLRTEAVPVDVKPLPAKNKTDSFTAAVGNFSIKAEVVKGALKKNEQGSLVISVTGKGNFTQITAPEINWPKGIDGFEPVIRDSIDRLRVPLAGTKTFRYSFVSNKPGQYKLDPVEFNFFNLDTNRFEKLLTDSLTIEISSHENSKGKIPVIGPAVAGNISWYWWVAIVVAGGAVTMLVIRKRKKRQLNVKEVPFPETPRLVIDEILLPPLMMLAAGEKNFYNELNKSVWKYLSQKIDLDGGNMSKSVLAKLLSDSGIEKEDVSGIIAVLRQCETGMYTNAISGSNNQELYDTARRVLKSIDEKI